MEIIVGLIAIAAVVYLITRKKEKQVVETQPEAAPYKVEAPAVEIPVLTEEVKPAKPQKAKKPATAKKPVAKPVTAATAAKTDKKPKLKRTK